MTLMQMVSCSSPNALFTHAAYYDTQSGVVNYSLDDQRDNYNTLRIGLVAANLLDMDVYKGVIVGRGRRHIVAPAGVSRVHLAWWKIGEHTDYHLDVHPTHLWRRLQFP